MGFPEVGRPQVAPVAEGQPGGWMLLSESLLVLSRVVAGSAGVPALLGDIPAFLVRLLVAGWGPGWDDSRWQTGVSVAFRPVAVP